MADDRGGKDTAERVAEVLVRFFAPQLRGSLRVGATAELADALRAALPTPPQRGVGERCDYRSRRHGLQCFREAGHEPPHGFDVTASLAEEPPPSHYGEDDEPAFVRSDGSYVEPPAVEPQPPERGERADHLGRLVRDAWVAWAKTQPDPKPSWLVPWDDLDEVSRDADRWIGMRLAAVLAQSAPPAVAPPPEGEQPFRVQPEVGTGNWWSVIAWTGRALSRDLSLEQAESDAAFLNHLFAARPSAAPPPSVEPVAPSPLPACPKCLEDDETYMRPGGGFGCYRCGNSWNLCGHPMTEHGKGSFCSLPARHVGPHYVSPAVLAQPVPPAVKPVAPEPAAPPPAMNEGRELVEAMRTWRESWRAGEDKYRRMGDDDDDDDLPAECRTLHTWEWREIASAYDELVAALDRAGHPEGGEATRP